MYSIEYNPKDRVLCRILQNLVLKTREMGVVKARGWNPDQEVHLVWVPSFKGLSGLVSGLVSGLGVH